MIYYYCSLKVMLINQLDWIFKYILSAVLLNVTVFRKHVNFDID